jgi:hypothetical protein
MLLDFRVLYRENYSQYFLRVHIGKYYNFNKQYE